MLENLSRASSSLLLGACGRCLFGRLDGEEDGRCGEDLDIVDDENEVDLTLTEEYWEQLETFEEDWILLPDPCIPASLLGDILLSGDPSLPVFFDVDLFLRIEWATTPDPFPVYSLSPMMITI